MGTGCSTQQAVLEDRNQIKFNTHVAPLIVPCLNNSDGENEENYFDSSVLCKNNLI